MAKSFLFFPLCFFLLGTVPVPATPAPASTAPVPAWVPAPTLAARLAPPTALGQFRIRLPQRYTASPKNFGGTVAYMCSGQDVNDPFFIVFVKPLPLKDRSRALQEITDGKTPMHLQGRGYTEVKQSVTEFGTIHAIPFKRLHWSGTESGEGRMQGFIYVGISGGALLQIQTESSAKSALDLAEASVLTFQPK